MTLAPSNKCLRGRIPRRWMLHSVLNTWMNISERLFSACAEGDSGSCSTPSRRTQADGASTNWIGSTIFRKVSARLDRGSDATWKSFSSRENGRRVRCFCEVSILPRRCVRVLLLTKNLLKSWVYRSISCLPDALGSGIIRISCEIYFSHTSFAKTDSTLEHPNS